MTTNISAMFNAEQQFPTLYMPLASGILKSKPEDFIVDEELSFQLIGEGEHAYLYIRKTGQNTNWVTRCLARHFNVKERDIGYAGLKDRQAITTQWFSLPNKSVTQEKIANFSEQGIDVLELQRHSGKLRKGAIRANHFNIILRNVAAAPYQIAERLEQIKNTGVPNYFSEQRFGRARQNLTSAQDMFDRKFKPKHQKRSLYLSAVRSWLFNQVLAKRVMLANWDQALDGEVFSLAGSKKVFLSENIDDQIIHRLIEHDIHPTGPLWGQGQLMSQAKVNELEQRVLDEWQPWCRALENAGLKQQRRALRVVPENFEYEYNFEKQLLSLSFGLPTGAYATNVIREIVTPVAQDDNLN